MLEHQHYPDTGRC